MKKLLAILFLMVFLMGAGLVTWTLTTVRDETIEIGGTVSDVLSITAHPDGHDNVALVPPGTTEGDNSYEKTFRYNIKKTDPVGDYYLQVEITGAAVGSVTITSITPSNLQLSNTDQKVEITISLIEGENYNVGSLPIQFLFTAVEGLAPETQIENGATDSEVENNLTVSLTYDFGTGQRTGYAEGIISVNNEGNWSNTTTSENPNKNRVQITTSNNSPHNNDMGAFLVFAPTSSVASSFIIFDFTDIQNIAKIEFDYSAWSETAANRILGFQEASIIIEVFTEGSWEEVASLDLLANLDSTIYKTFSFDVTESSLYRFSFAPVGSLGTGNTDQAITIDNLKVFTSEVE